MKLCIDIADVAQIRHIYEYFPVDGVSTNPSILAKEGRNPYDVLKEIRSVIGEEGISTKASLSSWMRSLTIICPGRRYGSRS